MRAMRLIRPPLAALLLLSCCCTTMPVRAGDCAALFDDGSVALIGCPDPAGVGEPPAPVYLDGGFVGDFRLIEAYDQAIPLTGCYPLTYVDIVANTYLRATYQKRDGGTAALGTSVVGAASFRTVDSVLHFVPQPSRADVFTGGPQRIRIELAAGYPGLADVSSTRTFADPTAGVTQVGLSVQFAATSDIELHAGLLGSDAFRMATASSMFLDEQTYDADLIRYENAGGGVQTIELTDDTPRDAHLLSTAAPIGGWFELIKRPGSGWFPDSPSVRVEIVAASCPSGCLGIQGYLAESDDANDDSLTVWLEWMGAPPIVAAGTVVSVDLLVTAFGDAELTAEQIAAFVPVLLGEDADPQHADWSDLNCDGLADGEDIQFFLDAVVGI